LRERKIHFHLRDPGHSAIFLLLEQAIRFCQPVERLLITPRIYLDLKQG
jgi:hypothetical protein